MSYKLKIARPDKEITSTEPRDYAFNSDYGSVKIFKQPDDEEYETVTINASSSQTVTIAHSLGFIPLCMVFTELNPGSGRWYNGVARGDPTDNDIIYINNVGDGTYADDTNLYINFTNNTASQKTVKYYYYIFGDTGE